MNLNTLSTEELIKYTNTIDELSDLEYALMNKIVVLKEDLTKAQDLLGKTTTIIDGAVDK